LCYFNSNTQFLPAATFLKEGSNEAKKNVWDPPFYSMGVLEFLAVELALDYCMEKLRGLEGVRMERPPGGPPADAFDPLACLWARIPYQNKGGE
jgi:hypothetical protein